MALEPQWNTRIPASQLPSSVVSVPSPDTGANAAARIAVAHEAPLNVEWPEYGAAASASDNTAAIQAAINALPGTSGSPRGGQLLLPNVYQCASSLTLNSSVGVELVGVGAEVDGYSGSLPRSGLVFTGTGAGNFINGQSSHGLSIRNMAVRYNNSGFTGALIDFGHDASATDSDYALIEKCTIGGVGVYSATQCIRLMDAILARVVGCHIQNAKAGWKGIDAGAGGYSNAHLIEGCSFDNLTVAAIMNPGQQLAVKGCWFEGTNDGVSGGMPHAFYDDLPAAAIMEAVAFIGCWFGDDIAASSAWIANVNGLFHGLSVLGCDFRNDNGHITDSLNLTAQGGKGLMVAGSALGGTNGILMGTATGSGTVAWDGVTVTGNDCTRLGATPLGHITDGYHKNVVVLGNSLTTSGVKPPTLVRTSNNLEFDIDETGVVSFSRPTAGGAIQINGTIGVDGGGNRLLSFYGGAPIAKPSAVGAATGYTAGTTAATFHSDDTYTGNVGTTAYTLNGIVAALKNLGLIAS